MYFSLRGFNPFCAEHPHLKTWKFHQSCQVLRLKVQMREEIVKLNKPKTTQTLSKIGTDFTEYHSKGRTLFQFVWSSKGRDNAMGNIKIGKRAGATPSHKIRSPKMAECALGNFNTCSRRMMMCLSLARGWTDLQFHVDTSMFPSGKKITLRHPKYIKRCMGEVIAGNMLVT